MTHATKWCQNCELLVYRLLLNLVNCQLLVNLINISPCRLENEKYTWTELSSCGVGTAVRLLWVNVIPQPSSAYQPPGRRQKNRGAKAAGSHLRSPCNRMMRTHWCCWWQCLDLGHSHKRTLWCLHRLLTKFFPPSTRKYKKHNINHIKLLSLNTPVLKVNFSLRSACCCCAGNSLLTFLITTLL